MLHQNQDLQEQVNIIISCADSLVNVHIYLWLGITSLPGVASASAGTDETKALILKWLAFLASVMVTGCRVIVNEFCTSFNRKTIDPPRSPSLTM